MQPAFVPIPVEHPVDAMLACHERIRRFLDGAHKLATLDDPADPRARAAALACARYFREGLPLHALDEDTSLAPRLRRVAPRAIGAALDRIAAEHEHIHTAIDAMLPWLDATAATGVVPRELGPTVDTLAGRLLPHLALEEELVFPAARRWICDPDQALIRAEMVRRRR